MSVGNGAGPGDRVYCLSAERKIEMNDYAVAQAGFIGSEAAGNQRVVAMVAL
jgi:hypothetical protein